MFFSFSVSPFDTKGGGEVADFTGAPGSEPRETEILILCISCVKKNGRRFFFCYITFLAENSGW